MTAEHDTGYIATVGMFDGVHRGHAFALSALGREADTRGLTPLVFTFDEHPLSRLAPAKAPRLLSTVSQREELIKEILPSAKTVVLSLDTLAMTATDFLRYAADKFNVVAFALGFNNHIGSDRADATAITHTTIPIVVLPPLDGGDINSSSIRAAIHSRNFDTAADMLGHRWIYSGTVIHGKALGRTIGFPTANIAPAASNLILPPPGVYAVDTAVDGQHFPGVANIGHRPTVDAADAPLSFEIHLFDIDTNLYGKKVAVNFIKFIRNERKFDSVDELKLQLSNDADTARQLLTNTLL